MAKVWFVGDLRGGDRRNVDGEVMLNHSVSCSRAQGKCRADGSSIHATASRLSGVQIRRRDPRSDSRISRPEEEGSRRVSNTLKRNLSPLTARAVMSFLTGWFAMANRRQRSDSRAHDRMYGKEEAMLKLSVSNSRVDSPNHAAGRRRSALARILSGRGGGGAS